MHAAFINILQFLTTQTCSYIDSDINQFCIIGDMNYSQDRRFFPILNQLAISNYLNFADTRLLSNIVTYVSNDGMHESWIDYVLCSQNSDNNITSISVLNDYVIYDHRPLLLCLNCNFSCDDMSDNYTRAVKMCPQWDKADGTQIDYYQKLLDAKLFSVKCNLVNSEVVNNSHLLVIDKYYNDIMAAIKFASTKAINSESVGFNDFVIAGWNDFVDEKHGAARLAYCEWCAHGKPRVGFLYNEICRTRALFK